MENDADGAIVLPVSGRPEVLGQPGPRTVLGIIIDDNEFFLDLGKCMLDDLNDFGDSAQFVINGHDHRQLAFGHFDIPPTEVAWVCLTLSPSSRHERRSYVRADARAYRCAVRDCSVAWSRMRRVLRSGGRLVLWVDFVPSCSRDTPNR